MTETADHTDDPVDAEAEARQQRYRGHLDAKYEYAIARGKPDDPWLKLFRWEPLAPFPVLRFLHGDWVIDRDCDTWEQIKNALKKGDLMRYDNRDAALTLSGVTCIDRYVVSPTAADILAKEEPPPPTMVSLMSYDAEWFAAEVSRVLMRSPTSFVVASPTKTFPGLAAQSEHKAAMEKHVANYLRDANGTYRWRSSNNTSVRATLQAWGTFCTDQEEEERKARQAELEALEQRMREKPAELTADEFSTYMARLRGE